MRRLILVFGLCFLLVGCNSFTSEQLKIRKQGIVDAVYVVIQNNPMDKVERIKNYLIKKQEQGFLTDEEIYILSLCIQRTQSSNKWSK